MGSRPACLKRYTDLGMCAALVTRMSFLSVPKFFLYSKASLFVLVGVVFKRMSALFTPNNMAVSATTSAFEISLLLPVPEVIRVGCFVLL